MSLREQLKRAVASCVPIEAQLATSDASNATCRATPAQQLPANPHETGILSATGSATPAQHQLKSSATFTPQQTTESCAPSCAAVASELTAHRLMKRLLAAAMRACDAHGDNPAAREQMRRDVLDTPPELRQELLAHFNREYPKR